MTTVTDAYSVAWQAERGLRDYVHRIATELNLGPEATYSEFADVATAYIALDHQLCDKPDRDLALIWDECQGWALAVETGCGEDLLVLYWYGSDLVPDPQEVAYFVRLALAGEWGDSMPPPWRHHGTLHARLTEYALVG